MRFSEGVPNGRMVELNKSELFQEHEEVIVFNREEFSRTYISIMERIDTITKIGLHLDSSEEWKLIGYWPKIMQNVHRIDLNMDLLFKKEPTQSYLDAYLSTSAQTPQKVSVDEKEPIPVIRTSTFNPLY